jgi:hypothetical protein
VNVVFDFPNKQFVVIKLYFSVLKVNEECGLFRIVRGRKVVGRGGVNGMKMQAKQWHGFFFGCPPITMLLRCCCSQSATKSACGRYKKRLCTVENARFVFYNLRF